MESISRLVSESFARHGFERPLDYRRLRWSHWSRCDSPHSLLLVPSKPGVFALAEEILSTADSGATMQEQHFSAPSGDPQASAALVPESRRMLAVTQFFEDDDMAFVLDRMLSRQNPVRARLVSGRYFVRFVVIEDPCQRRSICNALNQWIVSSAAKVSGIGSHFASSLELTPENFVVGTSRLEPNDVAALAESGPERSEPAPIPVPSKTSLATPHLDSGAAANRHCPIPFPSGF